MKIFFVYSVIFIELRQKEAIRRQKKQNLDSPQC